MFKNLILAVFVAVSFGGAILTSATPAAAVVWSSDPGDPREDVEFVYGK